jgi:hypothetical protein
LREIEIQAQIERTERKKKILEREAALDRSKRIAELEVSISRERE